MLRRLLQRIFRPPIGWLARRLSSAPKRREVFDALSALYVNIVKSKEGSIINFEVDKGKFIILSDQHKGAKDFADDFRNAEANFVSALEYYYNAGFTFVNLGDCEELWECTPATVIEKNRLSLLEEAKFLQSDRYVRVFGNHDLEWKYSIQQQLYLRPIFGEKLKVCEGLVLRTVHEGTSYDLFLTHGHQGDRKSDGNAFSTWFVAAIWTPVQRFLEISIDTVSDSFELVDKHNIMMYEWSATQSNLILVCGHTHKPIFASLDHIERLTKQLELATIEKNDTLAKSLTSELERRRKDYAGKKLLKTMAKPTYFNCGCCCFSDGDLTGIEIDGGFIRLIKWNVIDSKSERLVLEEAPLEYIFDVLSAQKQQASRPE
jgi:predicted phosphodiesterase